MAAFSATLVACQNSVGEHIQTDMHDCIHLRIGEAKRVYDWVDTKTYVTITRPW